LHGSPTVVPPADYPMLNFLKFNNESMTVLHLDDDVEHNLQNITAPTQIGRNICPCEVT